MKKLLIIPLTIALGVSSCATVPRKTIDLTEMLGRQIAGLEKSHVESINQYYDLRWSQISYRMDEVRYNPYIDKYFNDTIKQIKWDSIVRNPDTNGRLADIRKEVEKIHTPHLNALLSAFTENERVRRIALELTQEEYDKAETMRQVILYQIQRLKAINDTQKELLSKDNIESATNNVGKVIENTIKQPN